MRAKIKTELTENLLQRRRLLLLARDNLSVQRELKKLCAKDIVFFTSLFVWQFNPREKRDGEIGPFICWDFQQAAFDQLVWCVDNDEDLLIEKSRQMGASWMMVILFVWLWLFRRNVALLMISRDEKAVESDKPSSLFWKIDFILNYLPDWMMPKKWKRRKLYFGNEELGGSIFGEASTGKAGVGGTLTAMAIDEFSQIEDDYEVLHRTSDATGCRIFNGTHLGLDTAFYELSQRVDFRKLVLHWSQHPKRRGGAYRYDTNKNRVEVEDTSYPFPADYHFITDGSPTGGPFPGLRSTWYDRECRRKGDSRAIAMDLDIDPKGSVSQFFDPIVIQSLRAEYCCAPYWEGDIHWDDDTGKPLGLTRSPGGPLKLWLQLDGFDRPPPAPYKFGADVSQGVGATPSCLSGVNGLTGEKVLQYTTAHLDPRTFGTLCVAICTLFADESGQGGWFAWEQQGPGMVLCKRVLELGYPNIYMKQPEMTMKLHLADTPGWANNGENLRILLHDYRSALSMRLFINRCEHALLETLDYKWNQKGLLEHSGMRKLNPATGMVNHGDHVIADALACKLLDPRMLRRRQKEEVKKVGVGSLQWRRMLAEQAQEDEWGERCA